MMSRRDSRCQALSEFDSLCRRSEAVLIGDGPDARTCTLWFCARITRCFPSWDLIGFENGKTFWISNQTIDGKRVSKPAYWKEYVRQVDEGVISNPFGRGEANLPRMRQGLPPIGPDGKPVPLHHVRPLSRGGTNDFENLVPFNQTTHQRHTKILHSEPFPSEQYHLQQR
jgi:hypothetical protein